MAKRILVTYTSKYGATKKYAEWISAALNADCMDTKTIAPGVLDTYDVVVHGGGLYAGGIAGWKWILKHRRENVILFTVGLADPACTDYSAILNKNIRPELRKEMKVFHLQGGIDYQQLTPVHRVMMRAMKSSIQRKPEAERDAEDKEFLRLYNQAVHFEDPHAIAPLVAYAQSM